MARRNRMHFKASSMNADNFFSSFEQQNSSKWWICVEKSPDNPVETVVDSRRIGEDNPFSCACDTYIFLARTSNTLLYTIGCCWILHGNATVDTNSLLLWLLLIHYVWGKCRYFLLQQRSSSKNKREISFPFHAKCKFLCSRMR